MKKVNRALPDCLSPFTARLTAFFVAGILFFAALTAGAQIQTRVETKAGGLGTVVPAQDLAAGSAITVFAIVRDGGGNFLSNTVAAWSLTGISGGVVAGDLAPTIGTSATFSAHKIGSAVIQAIANSGTGVSGVQTVVAGSPEQTTVETAADGTGSVVPPQNLAAGNSLGVYAIARDSAGNFAGNPVATWSLLVVAGGVVAGDLTPASGPSAIFTGHLAGSAVVQASANGFTGQSGALTVTPGSLAQLVWSTQPGRATNGFPFAQQPVLMTADQFGNPTTTGLPPTLNVTVSQSAGNGPLAGTTTNNIGTAGGNGVVSFSNLEIDSPGNNKQLTASAPYFGTPVAGAAVWLDANDGTTIATDVNGSVTAWQDKSGNGNNFNQLLGTGFIGYTNNTTVSGRKTVTFPGTGSLLNNTYALSGTNLSFFLVSKKHTTGGAGNMGPFAGTDGVNNDYNNPNCFNVSYQGGNNIPQVQHNSHDAVYGNYEPSTAYHDLEYVCQDSSTIYINGHAGGNGGAGGGPFNITDLAIGSRLNGLAGQNFYAGDVGELLVYNSTLDTSDRVAVETYLSNKWFTASFPLNSVLAVSAVFTVYQPQTLLQVESKADGSGVIVPLETLAAGAATNVFAIQRNGSNGSFQGNVAAAWSLTAVTGGVAASDLAASGDGKSAVFTAHQPGSAIIQAVANGSKGVSGVQTVVVGPASRTTLETAADGSGTLVTAQNIAAGSAVTVFAIARDNGGNFAGNPAAAWSLQNLTGGVTGGDLTIAADAKSAVFTGHFTGSAVIQAVANGFTGQSGVLTVSPGPFAQLVWSTQPGIATNGMLLDQQPVLETADQFGNPTTNGLPATLDVTVTLNPGAHQLSGTTNFNLGTTGGDGVMTFTDLQIANAGPGNQLTAAVADLGAVPPGIPNCQLWLDASDPNAVNLSGNTVTTWNDKSGNGNNANAGIAPILATNLNLTGSAGLGRVLRFDGVSTYLNVNLGSLSGSPYTIIALEVAATKPPNGGNLNDYFIGNTEPSGNPKDEGLHMGYFSPTDFRLGQWADDLDYTVTNSTVTPRIWSGKVDASLNQILYLDGTQVAARTVANFLSGEQYTGHIGSAFDPPNPGDSTGNSYYAGDLAAVVVYNRDLTDAERNQVENFLGATWLTVFTNAVSAPFTVFGAITPGEPELSITLSGGNATISWPINGNSAFNLYSKTDLGTVGGWTLIRAIPETTGGNYQITLPATGATRFFRLSNQ